MADPKGEGVKLGFDGSIRLEFHGAKVTSDAGLLAYRDLDEALALFDSVPSVFHDSRTGRNIQHDLTALLRQSVYSRLAGYEDVNDAHRLSVDPTMRRITGKKLGDKNAASANTMGRFETQMLSVKDNLQALSEVNGRWVERALQKTTHRRIILDMDSSASPVHGEQEASGYNGHFGCTCYHPLFCFNQFGDCEGSMLRPGNVHSADRWREVLEPVVHVVAEGVRPLVQDHRQMRRPLGLTQFFGQLPQHRRVAIDRTDGHPLGVCERRQAVIGAEDVAGAIDQIEMILLGHGADVAGEVRAA